MGSLNRIQDFLHDSKKIFTWPFIKELATNPAQLPVVAFIIIVAELFINLFVVEHVPYTEIDWKAYMQECEGFINGTFDYSELRGDTGPLVYPAGFVYIYSILYFITTQGENIRLAQYIFVVIYLLQLCLVLRIYNQSKKIPPYVLVLTILTSYRIHSIYVLRLFNDPIAVLLLYISLNLFLDSKWYLGSVFYSLGVSVKMNILLYAPALFLFYLVNLGMKETIKQLLVCGLIQVLLGLIFLINSPFAYINASFDLGRVFNHTWTVNYRFLDIEIFENKCFHLTLLAIHLLLLIIFLPMCAKYFKSYCRLKYVEQQFLPQINAKNLEFKKTNKRKKDVKHRLNKIQENSEEKFSKDQEDFLHSFEAMLQKSSNEGSKKTAKKHRKPTKTVEKIEETDNYSLNFEILSQLFILPMFIINFIGIVCARSLHYQFYSWYFHSLPYLLWSNNFSDITRFLILALIEMCWNTYPSTIFTSVLLHICHLTILYGVYKKMSTNLEMASKLE